MLHDVNHCVEVKRLQDSSFFIITKMKIGAGR